MDQVLPLIPKPRLGAPCNGCGLCCAAEVCGIGRLIYGEDCAAPCPALVLQGGQFRCEVVLVEAASPLPKRASEALGIGRGCDSSAGEEL